MSKVFIESEKKRLTDFLADQTPVHEADKRRAKAYCAAQISIADYAIKTLQDHVAN